MNDCEKGLTPPGLNPNEFNEKNDFDTLENLLMKKSEKFRLS
jgi:hypothetical protein